jgi:ABC-type multidrug transport system fused ATPase/permease subunit
MRAVNKILKKEITANRWPLFLVLIMMLLTIAFEIIAPWPFKILIDNVLSDNPIEPGTFLAFLHTLFPSRDLLGFFAVFIYFSSTFALSLLEYLRAVYSKQVIKSMTADFSKAAFKNLQSLAIGFYNKQKIGDYIYRLGNDVSALGELIEDGVLPFSISILQLAVTIGIMSLISIKLTFMALAALPFLAYGLYSFNRRLTGATKRSEFLSSATFSFIEEALNHLKIIQAFSQEDQSSKDFNHRIDKSLQGDVLVYRLDFLLTLLVGMVIAISYSVIMLYGIRAVFAGTLTTGLLVVFIFYLDNLTTPIITLIYASTAMRSAHIKIMRMEEFFAKKSHLDYQTGGINKITDSDIRFEHVTLLGDEGKRILSNVSFTIEAGKRTVIFGGSGSGKTSVSNLLMRFIDKPSHGHVLIGKHPIDAYNLKSLRDAIAYVPQEITLFNESIKDNIVFGNKHHSIERVKRAARLADAEDFINKLPGKYDFSVGEGGTYLSGGQRQRLMLARALMKEEAGILIFDETFSALDVKTRKRVLDNVYNFSEGKTSIIISNIFDVITAADNIIVLNRGRLLFSGPAHRLPKEISLYNMIMENEPEPTV